MRGLDVRASIKNVESTQYDGLPRQAWSGPAMTDVAASSQSEEALTLGPQRHPRQIAGAGGCQHGFGPVPDAELAQDAFDVELDRAFEHVELARNFLVRF